MLTGSIASAGLYAYIAGSPYVFMELYKVTAQQYGWIFATIAGGLITSSQLNTYLLSRGLKSEQIVVGALICQSLIGAVFLIATLNGWLGALGTVGLIFAFCAARVLFFLIHRRYASHL